MKGSIVHFGIRTPQLEEMIRWYTNVLGATVLHRNAFAAFLTFDEEHHRLAIWTDEATKPRETDSACVDHLCVGLPDFAGLAAAYERLRELGITPFLPVNHRFTTSLYYRDPDGNELELSVDNFATKAEGTAFIRSEAMEDVLIPPFGDIFDPEDLVRLVRAGASHEELARLGQLAVDPTAPS